MMGNLYLASLVDAGDIILLHWCNIMSSLYSWGTIMGVKKLAPGLQLQFGTLDSALGPSARL